MFIFRNYWYFLPINFCLPTYSIVYQPSKFNSAGINGHFGPQNKWIHLNSYMNSFILAVVISFIQQVQIVIVLSALNFLTSRICYYLTMPAIFGV